jgi:hypothetical protein
MSESRLRGKILRLAALHAGLRPRLTEILREAGGLTAAEEQTLKTADDLVIPPGQTQPIVIQQVVNQGPAPAPAAPIGLITSPIQAPAPVPVAVPVAPPVAPALTPNQSTTGVPTPPQVTPPVSSLLVPERTTHGFNSELAPEMDKLLNSGMSREQVARDMFHLVRDSFSKKDMLYNIMIRYQSSFESNEDYLSNLESLIEAWATTITGA